MGDVSITFDGELSGIKSSLDGLSEYAKGVGDKIKTIGALAFAAWGIHEGAEGIKDLIDKASEAAQVDAKLGAVLESSGHAAGFSKEQLSQLAQSLEHLTLFDDEAVKGAETMIATFSEIRGDQFEKTTKLALDMATVMGGDATSAASELGKALNDPIRGAELLARQGVLLTQSQKDTIEQMTRAGNAAGAQSILIGELQKKYGGAAEAAAGAAGGGFKQLANIGDDIKEALGTGLLAVLDPLMPLFKEGAIHLQEWAERFQDMGPAIAEFTNKGIGYAIESFQFLQSIGHAILDGLEAGWEWAFGDTVVGTIGTVFDALTTAFIAVETVGGNFLTTASDGFVALWGVAVSGFEALEEIGTGVLIEIGDLWESAFGVSASESVSAVYDFVKEVFVGMLTESVGFFTAVEVGWAALPQVAEFTFKALELGAVTYYEQAKWTFTVAIPGLLEWLFDNWKEIFTDIYEFTKTIFSNIWENISNIFTAIVNWDFSGFEWAPLTKGFESAIKELPKIAEREMSPLEKQLTEQTGNIGAKLFGQFQELNKKNLDALGLGSSKAPTFTAPTDQGGGETNPDGTKKAQAGPGGKAPARADRSGDGGGSGSNVGEEASALFKRIASAASGENPQLKAAEKTADNTQEIRDHGKRAADAAERTATAAEKLAANGAAGQVAVLGK